MRLQISDLDVRFGTQPVVSVDELALGEAVIVGLAGESGSGKSMTTLAILGLAHTVGATVTGSIRLGGTELTSLPAAEMRAVRGRRIAAIFQSPSMSFSPVFRVGTVMLRALRLHGLTKAEAADRAAARACGRYSCRPTCCTGTRPSCPAASCSGSRSPWPWH